MHWPLRQTIPLPQDVPFARLPLSVQTGVPVVQAFDPVRHGLVGVQVVPAVHEAHVPLLQTMFVPHDVPFACARPVSAHDITPLAEQAVCPT